MELDVISEYEDLINVTKNIIEYFVFRHIFEPNDEIIRKKLENLINPIFEIIKNDRNIHRLKIEFDSLSSTECINGLSGNIIIKPTISSENITIEFKITI